MASTGKEIYEEKMRSEFNDTYSENDLLTMYCEEKGIILTQESIDNYLEEDFKEFVEMKYYEYKDLRD